MPPAASTGVGATASMICGHSTIEPDLAGVAAALGALRDDDVHTVLLVLHGLLDLAAQRRDQSPGGVDVVDDLLRRRAQRVGDQLHLAGASGPRRAAAWRWPRSSPADRACRSSSGQLRHAVLAQQLARRSRGAPAAPWPAAVSPAPRGRSLPMPSYLLRDHDVDAVGLVADVRVDPVELLAQLLRREAHGAEHAEAAGLADGDDHVAAVGEGEDREVDAETVTERSAHGCLPLVIAEAPIMAPAATRRQCKCGSTGRVQSDQARPRRSRGPAVAARRRLPLHCASGNPKDSRPWHRP